MDNKKRGFNKPKAQTFNKTKNFGANQSQSTSSQPPKKVRTDAENDDDFEDMDDDMDFLSQEEIDEDMDVNDPFCKIEFNCFQFNYDF